jgi:hypothetical protein
MTSPRDDGRFEVPVARLAGGRGQARRAAAVAATLVLAVGGAFGIARLSETRASPSPVAGSLRPATSAIAAAPSPSRVITPRVERLLPVERVPLPGAPEVTLVERTGDGGAIRIFVWTPDDTRTRTIRVIRNVLPGDASEPILPVVSPNRRHVALLVVSDRSDTDAGTASVVEDDGSVVWTGTRISAGSGALWSADSRLLVVTGKPRQWHLVTLDRPEHATERTVTLPGDVYLPTPLPRSWLSVSSLEPRTVPLGFSADGAWIYGGVISPELGMLVGEFRVASDGSTVEALTDFRVGQPDGLVPRPGTLGTRTVDPVTGRVATARVNTDTAGGPQTVEVRAADAAHLFDVPGGVTFSWEWGDDGALYALTGNTFVFPDEIDLVRLDGTGQAGPPIVATGPLGAGALIGVRDGFAVLGLLATRPDTASQLVAVDLAHPDRMTALPDPGTDLIAASLDR